MDTKDQENLIHELGHKLAVVMRDFYGSVRINICGGKYVNSNVEQSLKPEKQETKQNG